MVQEQTSSHGGIHDSMTRILPVYFALVTPRLGTRLGNKDKRYQVHVYASEVAQDQGLGVADVGGGEAEQEGHGGEERGRKEMSGALVAQITRLHDLLVQNMPSVEFTMYALEPLRMECRLADCVQLNNYSPR